MSAVVMNDAGQELRQGDVWHVKLGASPHPKVVKLVDLTSATVKVMEMPFSYLQPTFTIHEIKFLAKVTEDGEEG